VLRASVAVLATRRVVSILPAGTTGLFVDLGVLALVGLLAEGLTIDFLETAMGVTSFEFASFYGDS